MVALPLRSGGRRPIHTANCCYVARGYRYYVRGQVPARVADPREVDRKIISKYGLAISKAERSRRKLLGRASVQYLRRGRLFVLMKFV